MLVFLCVLKSNIKLSSCQTGPPAGSVHTFSFPDFLFYLNPQSYLPYQLLLSFWDLPSSHLGYKTCFWKNRAYVSRVYSRPWAKPQGSEDGSTWGPVLRALLSEGRDRGHTGHPVLWQRSSQRAVCAQRGTLTPKMANGSTAGSSEVTRGRGMQREMIIADCEKGAEAQRNEDRILLG